MRFQQWQQYTKKYNNSTHSVQSLNKIYIMDIKGKWPMTANVINTPVLSDTAAAG